MIQTIPISVIKGWVNELQSLLKQESKEPRTQAELWIDKGMSHGLDQVQHRITTWLCHQGNMDRLSQSGKKFLVTKDVNLSRGRYRKLEWYEGDLFLTLAWRHAQGAATGELMLEIQQVRDLSKTFLVYEGSSSFDDLAALPREGGLEAVRNEGNRQEWVEKVWT